MGKYWWRTAAAGLLLSMFLFGCPQLNPPEDGQEDGNGEEPPPADITGQEMGEIVAADGATLDRFGASVAISGNRAIVGSYQDDDRGTNSGSAYIYEWDGAGWVLAAKLTADDGAAYDRFGRSVDLSGDYAVVGAPEDDNPNGNTAGAAYVFFRQGGSWAQQAKLVAGAGSGDSVGWFGISVAIDGDRLIVGSKYDDNSNGEWAGSAYIFHKSGANWLQVEHLLASDGAEWDFFGTAVDICGDYALVSANLDDNERGYDAGAAYIYRWDGGQWVEQDKLTASDGADSDALANTVALSADFAVLGEQWDDAKGDYAGAVHVYRRSGADWIEQQTLTASDGAADDLFGCSVGIHGNCLAVGAYGHGNLAGAVYLFCLAGTDWVEALKLQGSGMDTGDMFGCAVSLDGDRVIAGAEFSDTAKATQAGCAYIFD